MAVHRRRRCHRAESISGSQVVRLLGTEGREGKGREEKRPSALNATAGSHVLVVVVVSLPV